MVAWGIDSWLRSGDGFPAGAWLGTGQAAEIGLGRFPQSGAIVE